MNALAMSSRERFYEESRRELEDTIKRLDADEAKKTLEMYMKKYPEGKFSENARSILKHLSGD